MNKTEFKNEMKKLEACFMAEYREETIKVFFDGLKDVEYEIFQRACAEMRKPGVLDKLPTLSTIWEFIDAEKHAEKNKDGDEDEYQYKPLTKKDLEELHEAKKRGLILAATVFVNSNNAALRKWGEEYLRKINKDPEKYKNMIFKCSHCGAENRNLTFGSDKRGVSGWVCEACKKININFEPSESLKC